MKIFLKSYSSDYFCRNNTERLKGGLALAVLLHHLYQKTNIVGHDSLLGFFMQSLGYYCVSLFFFISGFGLIMSANRGGYLQTYQRNRVLPIFVINAILVIVYVIEKFLFGVEVTFNNVLMSLTYGGDIVENGWYLLCIIIFYELFYLSARFSSTHICKCIFTLTIAYMSIAVCLGMSVWWYISSLAFPCGVLFGSYKLDVDKHVRKNKTFFMVMSAVLFIICFLSIYWLRIEDVDNGMCMHYIISIITLSLSVIHGLLACFLVVVLLMMFGRYVNREGKVVNKLSTIYLEIYVMQGAAFLLLRNSIWNLNNDILFALISVMLTVVFALVIHPIFKIILSAIIVSYFNC